MTKGKGGVVAHATGPELWYQSGLTATVQVGHAEVPVPWARRYCCRLGQYPQIPYHQRIERIAFRRVKICRAGAITGENRVLRARINDGLGAGGSARTVTPTRILSGRACGTLRLANLSQRIHIHDVGFWQDGSSSL